jgi:uncharacterized protein (DUF362 family)
MHRVMIQPASYDNCAEAVDRAFERFPLEIAGKKVMIKPNLLRSSSADEHIVTHPALLRSVVAKVEALSPAEIGVSSDILDADILISLPKFKTHGLTVMTGAIKNSYGILSGAQKANHGLKLLSETRFFVSENSD